MLKKLPLCALLAAFFLVTCITDNPSSRETYFKIEDADSTFFSAETLLVTMHGKDTTRRDTLFRGKLVEEKQLSRLPLPAPILKDGEFWIEVTALSPSKKTPLKVYHVLPDGKVEKKRLDTPPGGEKPRILRQPEPQSVEEGGRVQFLVEAEGQELKYRWLKDGFPLAGDQPVLVISQARFSDSGNYRCEVENSSGKVSSQEAKLKVLPRNSGPLPVELKVMTVHGKVTINPAKTSWTRGDTARLNALPDEGYEFSGWSGSLEGLTNPLGVRLDSSMSITATFKPLAFALNLLETANGAIDLGPGSPKPSYGYFDTLVLTAKPATGYVFVGWLGDTTGNQNPLRLVLRRNKSIGANFQKDGTYTVTTSVSPQDGGRVEKTPNRSTYTFQESITLTAIPDTAKGYRFLRWQSGTTTFTDNPLKIGVDAHKTLSGVFEKKKYTLSLTTDGKGSVSPASVQAVHGDTVILPQPQPSNSSAFEFQSWSVDSGSAKLLTPASATSASVILTGAARLKANFKSFVPAAPTLLEPKVLTGKSVQLGWGAVSKAETYTLYYKIGNTGFALTDAGVKKVTSVSPKHIVADLENKGQVTFLLTASNAAGESPPSAPKTILVNVKPVLEAVSDRTIAENSALTLNLRGSDADGGALTYSMTGGPSGATLNAATGIFNWTPGFNESSRSSNKVYSITFKVSDGAEEGTTTTSITVSHVNRSPVWKALGDQKLSEIVELHRLYIEDLEISDPDGDPVIINYLKRPVGFNYDSNQKKATWFADRNFFMPGAILYEISIDATDGEMKTNQSWSIKINPRQWTPIPAVYLHPDSGILAVAALDSNQLIVSRFTQNTNLTETSEIINFNISSQKETAKGIISGRVEAIAPLQGLEYYGGMSELWGRIWTFPGRVEAEFQRGPFQNLEFSAKGNAGAFSILNLSCAGCTGTDLWFKNGPNISVFDSVGIEAIDIEGYSSGENLVLLEEGLFLVTGPQSLLSLLSGKGFCLTSDFINNKKVYLVDASRKLKIANSSNKPIFHTVNSVPANLNKLYMLSDKLGWSTNLDGEVFFTNSEWADGYSKDVLPGAGPIKKIFFSRDGSGVFALDENNRLYRY